MTVRTLYVLSDGNSMEERPGGLGPSPAQYERGRNVYVVHRIWSGSNVQTDTVYEICCEPSIPNAEALNRARQWNADHPAMAVPPPGAVLR